jgi:hypothetical protein
MLDGKTITPSPRERLPIHLTSLKCEETYVSLVALKAVFAVERRTRYWVCRFAGGMAAKSPSIRDSTHRHGEWCWSSGPRLRAATPLRHSSKNCALTK